MIVIASAAVIANEVKQSVFILKALVNNLPEKRIASVGRHGDLPRNDNLRLISAPPS
ncbi:MAG: hypothetical protein LHV69_00440 [Elusimicrobia bacterium]|nr:hypothetical protein [Candidatus Obscuribacterium magneticum]MCB4755497.1 hypothetical protein [Candidatus Obscuribacterium magneticum]